MMNTMDKKNICGLKQSDFQAIVDHKETDLFILSNAHGNEVAITNYGGAVVALMVPDKNGVKANIIQGHDNIQDVISSPEPFLSTLIGRYGNRICKGKFKLHGKEYQLAVNNGPNHLHGGPKGFHARVWDAQMMNEQTLVFHYVSAYGEEGYSGELKTTVMYTFTNDNELIIEYLATTNKKTIINLTHHGFFSLSGIGNPTPSIENMVCEINANYYIPIDKDSIPTGEILKVDNTPFDFRTPKTIGQDIEADHEQIKHGAGYDHCFVINNYKNDQLRPALLATSEGVRSLEIQITAPGAHLYTGNWLDEARTKDGAIYKPQAGFAFESEFYPDCAHHAEWPQPICTPEHPYNSQIVYRFF